MRPHNAMVTIATAPSMSALGALQQALAELDDTPSLVRPVGGWRTKRCSHGLRCDPEEWLCDLCKPTTREEETAYQRTLGHYRNASSGQCADTFAMQEAICTALKSAELTSLRELTDAVSRIRGKRIPTGPIAASLYKLRREGRVEGMRVIG